MRYKEKVKEVGEELELASWLQELIISTLEKEEKNRELQEMAAWLEKLENDGRLPADLEDENLLLDIYRDHTSWVEKSVQFHIDVRKDDNEKFESLINAVGEPITSMPIEAQNAYLALWRNTQCRRPSDQLLQIWWFLFLIKYKRKTVLT